MVIYTAHVNSQKEHHHEEIEIDALSTRSDSGGISMSDRNTRACIATAINELLHRMPEKMAAMRC